MKISAKRKLQRNILRKISWILQPACDRFWTELFDSWTEGGDE